MKANPRKLGNLLWCALFITAFCHAAAETETLFNGSYQIELREADYVSATKGQLLLKAGEKSNARMGPTDIEIWISPASEAEYDLHLTVTVAVAPNRPSPLPARVDRVFRGRFGVPLELVHGEGPLKVKGSATVLRYMPRT